MNSQRTVRPRGRASYTVNYDPLHTFFFQLVEVYNNESFDLFEEQIDIGLIF